MLGTYIEIQVIGSQRIKSLLQTLLDVGLVRVPELASDEDFFTGHTAVPDTLADLIFVAWEELEDLVDVGQWMLASVSVAHHKSCVLLAGRHACTEGSGKTGLQCSINVSVSVLESKGHGLCYLSRLGFPCSWRSISKCIS